MRESIPKGKVIDGGFRVLAKRLGGVQRSINAEAARCMRAGEYDAVQRWMEVGKSVADFAERLEAFAQEWKRLVKATRVAASRKTTPATTSRTSPAARKATPASRFYEPAMNALARRGGEATSEQLLQSLETTIGAQLTEADLKTLPGRGIPRWHRTMEGVYRDSVREGWVEKRRDKVWKLAEKGKQLAAGRRAAPKG